MNKLAQFMLPMTCSKLQVASYRNLRNLRDILADRYSHRNKDGSYKRYNETITLVPEKYKNQGK